MKKLYILSLMACSLAACKPNIDPQKPESGTLQPERYLAVGDAFTAGFTDGSLFRNAQESSYPAMLSAQFDLVGGGDFFQPLLPGENGYPNAKRVLKAVQGPCDAAPVLKPVLYNPTTGVLDTIGSSTNIASETEPFNNMGIPGIRTVDYITPGYGVFNPYSRRSFLKLGVRPIDEVIRLKPTFFTLWTGTNDVLDYAIAGGTESGKTISNAAAFQAAYDSIVAKLTQGGLVKGVSLNIPDITGLPYFSTIPANGLKLTQRQANDLNVRYNGTFIHFIEGTNNFVIQDGTETRMMREGELVLLSLPLDSLCWDQGNYTKGGWGSVKPIPGRYVLTLPEVTAIKTAIAEFNVIQRDINNTYNVPIVDMNSFFKTLQSGTSYNGVNYSTTFVSGNAISLDGVHPTARGYALIANQIITVINQHFSATIPYVDANRYPGIVYP